MPLSLLEVPALQNRKQTFKFVDFLVKAIQSGEIAISTARIYLRAIVSFYKFLGRNNLMEFSERNKPFDFEMVSIRQTGILSIEHFSISFEGDVITELKVMLIGKEANQLEWCMRLTSCTSALKPALVSYGDIRY